MLGFVEGKTGSWAVSSDVFPQFRSVREGIPEPEPGIEIRGRMLEVNLDIKELYQEIETKFRITLKRQEKT